MSQATVARAKVLAKRLNDREALRVRAFICGLTNAAIATACDPPVDPSLISHWFACRADSSNVERTVHRELKRRERRGA